ncbi:hypothetical protein NEOLI_004248 [Neolecta irregularis DAH-3]|uniref:Uncharacterized protein n=1 Tax=Neolecta irregularis (strain DAH-3) TaxID=1198029 RepID=A0A1U7LM46_NEOID|nr:hypothetical protein NEOLI_004248 [Neolecta irregularis DAH-3]|eukprot:OLL23740.1 hypothetical protein NEOLI_004248 [Neolecta irregularis DAH-3]
MMLVPNFYSPSNHFYARMESTPLNVQHKSSATTIISGLEPLEMIPYANSRSNLLEDQSWQQKQEQSQIEAATSKGKVGLRTHILLENEKPMAGNLDKSSFHEHFDLPNNVTNEFLKPTYQNSDGHYSHVFSLLISDIQHWTKKTFSRQPSKRKLLKPGLQTKFTDYVNLSTGPEINLKRIRSEKNLRIYIIQGFIWSYLIEKIFTRDFKRGGTIDLRACIDAHNPRLRRSRNRDTWCPTFSRSLSNTDIKKSSNPITLQVLTNISTQLNSLSPRKSKFKKLEELLGKAYHLAIESQFDTIPAYLQFDTQYKETALENFDGFEGDRVVLFATPAVLREERVILQGKALRNGGAKPRKTKR